MLNRLCIKHKTLETAHYKTTVSLNKRAGKVNSITVWLDRGSNPDRLSYWVGHLPFELRGA